MRRSITIIAVLLALGGAGCTVEAKMPPATPTTTAPYISTINCATMGEALRDQYWQQCLENTLDKRQERIDRSRENRDRRAEALDRYRENRDR